MSKRYTPRRELLEMIEHQKEKCGCGALLIKGDFIIEHSIPIALGGGDIASNKYLNCKSCADKKTHGGKAKATTYGSDIHAIWKVKRLRGELKPKMKRAIRSRGFDKTKTKHFDGRITTKN